MAKSKAGVGDRIREAMEAKGWNRVQLAAALKVTQPAVSQWVLGAKNPTEKNLAEMAVILGVTPMWLAEGLGAMKAPPTRSLADERAEMESLGWQFRPAPKDGGRDFGNSNVWSFNPGLEVFVREVLQNAKDAAAGPKAVVRVRFRFITLTGDDLDDYRAALKWAGLEPHLSAAAVGKQKFNTLLADGLEKAGEKVVLLLVEDDGTTGLTGPERGSGAFTGLCRNNLDSNKNNDAGAGGAFGLGKAVLWRASRLSTVLFHSHLSVPEGGHDRHRVFGRCELAWHQCGEDKDFAGPGWFGALAEVDGDEAAESVWGNAALADALYLTREKAGEAARAGTTACVVGFHDASDDADRPPAELAREVVRHAAVNFFPAMVARKLSVTVEVYDGGQQFREGKAALTQTVNPADHLPAQVRMLERFRTGEVKEQFEEEEGEVVAVEVPLTVPARKADPKHAEQQHRAMLLVTAATDDEPEGAKDRRFQLSVFRGPGMVVARHPLQAACLGARPFHALLVCGKGPEEVAPDGPRAAPVADAVAEQFLRVAEPPSHDRWTATPDLKAMYAVGCKKKLEQFLKDAKGKLQELVKPVTKDTGDGPDALKELFQIGSEPSARPDQPKVIPMSSLVDAAGRWCVEARLRLKPRKTARKVSPAVFFLAETGSGTPVKWLSLEGVKDCEADGQVLTVKANVREVRFRGVTDPTTHPIPAGDSCVVVDIKKPVEFLPEVNS